jgi:hypothetical protein
VLVVLLQDQRIGLQHVACHAWKMNKHEVLYLVHEKDVLDVRDALLKFRCYLLDGAGGFIVIITDHETLRHFFRQRDLSTRQVRWLQALAPYRRQMDIVYKKGAVNNRDALFRRPDKKDSLKKLQLLRDSANDATKCELHEQIFSLESRLYPNFGLHTEIKNAYDSDTYMLSWKSPPPWLARQSNGIMYTYGTRLHVPDVSTWRSRVLYDVHEAPTVGHLDITRLLAKVTRTFWWPNMNRSRQHYVRKCVTCQRNKATRHKPYVLLQPHEVHIRPFEHVSEDSFPSWRDFFSLT